MAAPRKFLFDQSFDLPDSPRNVVRQTPPPPPPEPTFSRAEVEAARAAAAAAARAATLAEAAQSIEERAAGAVESLARGLGELLQDRERLAEQSQRQTLEIARLVTRKLAPALARRDPVAELEGFIAECLQEAFDEPRVVLRVAEGVFETVQKRLSHLTTAAGYPGRVILLGDDALGPGDARVEWADGGAERNSQRLLHDLEAVLARAIEALAATPAIAAEEKSP